MPIYQYECQECGHSEELILRIGELDSNQQCPSCPEGTYMGRHCGNKGGFRLGPDGSVGWASDGYGDTHGDIENFKARDRGEPIPYPKGIGKQR